jgi:hypothetical protein
MRAERADAGKLSEQLDRLLDGHYGPIGGNRVVLSDVVPNLG